MKLLFLLCFALSAALANTYGQKPTEKTIKLKNVNYPIVPLQDVKSYKVIINNGNIPVDLMDLKEKKGLTSKMQGWQDDINNKTPDYYSYTKFNLDPSQPDAIIEFSFGTFRQIVKEIKEHKIPCVIKGQKISKETMKECPAYFYEIKYSLPYVIRITDKKGNLILNEHNKEEGVDRFGFDKSGMSGFLKKQELETAYQNAIQKNQFFMAEKALINKIEESEALIQGSFYYSRFTEKIDIVSATGKGFEYAALDQAQASAVAAYDKLSKGDVDGAKSDFEKAYPVWKKEAATVDMGNDNARINRKIATGIYLNLTYAYLNTWELDSAGSYLSDASRVGKFSNKGEELIALSNLITKRKELLTAYKVNKGINGKEVDAENLLEKIRVNQKNALYNPLTNDNKYHAYTQSTQPKEELTQEQKIKELFNGLGGNSGGSSDKSNSKSNKFEERVQKTSFQGYVLILSAFLDGKMDTLPQQICDITYLNELNISNNTLTYVPSDIGKLKDLKKLDLDNNKLTSLPAEIGMLQNLKMLSVKGNKIPKEEIDKIQKMLPKCKIKS